MVLFVQAMSMTQILSYHFFVNLLEFLTFAISKLLYLKYEKTYRIGACADNYPGSLCG